MDTGRSHGDAERYLFRYIPIVSALPFSTSPAASEEAVGDHAEREKGKPEGEHCQKSIVGD